MISNRLRNTLRGVVMLAAGIAAPLTVQMAKAQHLPSYGLPVIDQIRQGMTNQPPLWPGYQPHLDEPIICRNVMLQYPAEHLLLLVRGHPTIRVDCGNKKTTNPVYKVFDSIDQIGWYINHVGHREILPDEDDNG